MDMIPGYTLQQQAGFVLESSEMLGFPLSDQESAMLLCLAMDGLAIVNMRAAERFVAGFYMPVAAWIAGVHPDLHARLIDPDDPLGEE